MLADLAGIIGQLDATSLASATDAHLGLDDHRIPNLLGLCHRFVHRVGFATRRDRDAELGEVLLALILEQIHSLCPFYCLAGRWSPQNPTKGEL